MDIRFSNRKVKVFPLTKMGSGHRERLRFQFLTGEEGAYNDEELLELILTYAIPQKDIQPLAKELIAKLGSLKNVLLADMSTLCNFDGIKTRSAILLKVIDWICNHHTGEAQAGNRSFHDKPVQYTLFESKEEKLIKFESTERDRSKPTKRVLPRRGTGLFVKAVLKEAIDLLPKLPDTESLQEVKAFLRQNLHFSAEQTRKRYSNYIVFRMFPSGHADKALRKFAIKYPGRQELKDVCLYRFCKAEPLMYEIMENLFSPAIGTGCLKRARLREYLQQRFPSSKSIRDSAKAIIEALAAGGVVKTDRMNVNFSYRDPSIPSFAFILHSEFPEPGMYDVSKLESNQAIRSMFWNPVRLIPALYELRNLSIISKISEIDNIRQFTTRWTLDELATRLPREKSDS